MPRPRKSATVTDARSSMVGKRAHVAGVAPAVAGLVEVDLHARRGRGRGCRWCRTRRYRRAGCAADRTGRASSNQGARPSSPWRRTAHIRDWASSRPRRCGCGRGRTAHRRSCRRDRSIACRRRTRRGGRASSSEGRRTRIAGAEALFRAATVPGEGVVLGDQHVGDAVAGEIDEA